MGIDFLCTYVTTQRDDKHHLNDRGQTMPFNTYLSKRDRHRRVWMAVIKITFFCLLILGSSFFAYQTGVEQTKARELAMREQFDAVSNQKGQLKISNEQLKNKIELTNLHINEMAASDVGKLSQIVKGRLEAGITADRLAFVISQAQNRRNCQPAETKRLQPSTEINESTSSTISFDGKDILVTGKGMVAHNTAGGPEGWYDPQQPVIMRVTPHNGQDIVINGTLPLQRSLVVENIEYRFSATAGPRSFIEIRADRCDYP